MMKDGGSRVTASVETRPSASDRRGGHLRLYALAGAPAVKCNGWYKSTAEDDDADATPGGMAIDGPMYIRWMFKYMALNWFYAKPWQGWRRTG